METHSPPIPESWDTSHMTRIPKLSGDAGVVAREVHRRMTEMGVGQKALALAAGLNETYVRDLFRGRSVNQKLRELRKLADALECQVEDLTKQPPTQAAQQRAEKTEDLSALVIDGRELALSELALVRMWRNLELPARYLVMAKLAELSPDSSGDVSDLSL